MKPTELLEQWFETEGKQLISIACEMIEKIYGSTLSIEEKKDMVFQYLIVLSKAIYGSGGKDAIGCLIEKRKP